jgi:flagellar basal-body rod protein FlgC
MVAQRTRMEVTSANLANQNSIYNAEGEYEPFRRRIAVLAPGAAGNSDAPGVHVREIMQDEAPLKRQYEPGHPEADENGYVRYPNVDPMMEAVNAMEASRAYEANVTAAESTKQMLRSSMQLLA